MKIVEALKGLRVIEKKIKKNTEQIGEYSSILSNEKSLFGDEKGQEKKVRELIQSNQDLLTYYLKVKRAIEKTNLVATVEVGGVKYTLSDALTIKRKMARHMLDTYNALSTRTGDAKLGMRRMSVSGDPNQIISVLRMYQETDKLDGLTKWQDLYDNLESRLEVINATTDLVEDPGVEAGIAVM